MSTATAARLAAATTEVGASFLDAPVSGSVATATEGALTLMVGGPAPVFETARRLAAEGGAVLALDVQDASEDIDGVTWLRGDVTDPGSWAAALEQAGQGAEVASAIAFLASDDASFVTGVQLLVHGGYTTV